MRRVVGVATGIAFVLAFSSTAIGRTSALSQEMGRIDLGAQLMLRVFGETSDSSASFAASRGDRTSESPLRELALQLPSSRAKGPTPSGIVAFASDRLALRDLSTGEITGPSTMEQFGAETSVVHFTVAVPNDDDVTLSPNQHVTVAYQPISPEPTISPEPGTLAFSASGSHVPGFVPDSKQAGALRFEGHYADASAQNPGLAGDATYGAGANLNVRAGKRSLNVNLSSQYQQAGWTGVNSFSAAPLAPASSWELPGESGSLAIPSYPDLNRLSLGAGVSVPVMSGLTLNLNYDAQHLYGAYGLPGFVNLDTVSNTYGGKLTFNIPQISSSLSIGAYQDRFQDSNLPITGQTQTREDVNFTVKF